MKLPFCLLAIIAFIYLGCTKESERNNVDKVSITSIAPANGPAGTTVVIKGTHFAEDPFDNIVRFNNDSAAVVSASVDSLVVIAPQNGTSGAVTVTVDGSTATGPVFTYTADSVDVYVSAPAMGVVYWKNGKEVFLESTQSNIGGAYGIAVGDTNVYVGGHTTFNIFPGSQAAYWKDGKKTALTSRDSAGDVRTLVLAGNDLYVGGSQNQRPVYWKNGVMYRLPIVSNGYARVNALAVNGNDVFAVGFEAGPENEQRLVYWKNGVQTLLGKKGVVGLGAASIVINGNDVYVCGTDSGNAVYWKNGVRVTLERFPGDGPVDASAIALIGNSIYVVGSYRGDAVYWKDGTKITLPKRGFSAAATAIGFYKSDIYIGGRDGNSSVYWKNGTEVSLCCSQGGFVSAIAVVKKR